MPRLSRFSLVALLLAVAASRITAAEPEKTSPASSLLAEFFSPVTLAYVEITAPERLLEPALEADLDRLLEPLEPYRKYKESKDYRDLTAVVGVLERKLATDWRTGLRTLVGGGVAFGFDPTEQAVIILVRSRDADQLNHLHEAIVELVETDARNKGKASPATSAEYRGVTGWSTGKNGAHAILGDTIIVSNKSDALKSIVDRRLDQKPTLASDEGFQTVRKQAGDKAAGFGFVRLGPLKLLAGLSKLFGQKSDNPLAELLAGGILDTLAHADHVALAIEAQDDRWKISLRLPRDREQLGATRRWYFASQQGASADAPLVVPDLLATLSTYRDLGGFWTNRNELFDEKTNVGFTQADTNLGLYFSGRDFGTQVLAELEPQWQFVSALHDFAADGEPVPALKLPNLAVVWRLKHPAEFAPHLQMAFQNIVGITNLDGVQKGRPQLLLKSESRGKAEIHYGSYLTVGETPSTEAPIHFNFRPACARIGSYFVLGTHVALVRNLSAALESAPAERATTDNLRFEVDAAPLRKILDANRSLILGRAMLSSGGDRDGAERRLDVGLELLEHLKGLAVRLVDHAESVALEAELRIDP
jgi:hypothetical protein